MARKHCLVGGAAALVNAALVAACSPSKDIVMPTPVSGIFASYVALGNSITSGFQSGGILDSTQDSSYAVLFAQQVSTRFAVPELQWPGCPPPINNFLTQGRLAGGASNECALRVPSSVTPIINNVAVPGAATVDPTGASTANSNFLTTLFLGGATQDQRAVQANPTFATIWIGNNDVLPAALSGILVPTAPYSPGVTPQATFVSNYNKMISGLSAAKGLKSGVLFAVVDVTNAPLLFHSNLLNLNGGVNPYRAGFEAAAGTPVAVDVSCDDPVPLISFQMTSYIKAGTLPPIIYCVKGVLPAPVGDLFVLDAVEVPQVQADVANYNAYIKAEAATLGWAYVDVNPLLQKLKTAGLIPPFPNLASPTQTFGPYVTLDGIHPSALSHDSITNLLIDSVNAHYGTTIQKLQ